MKKLTILLLALLLALTVNASALTVSDVNVFPIVDEPYELTIHGRHDPCVVPRAVPVIEAAAALAACEVLGI